MIDLSGENAVLGRLRTLEQTIEAVPILDDVAKAALPTLRIYPAELPNQQYVRTEDLKRGWQYGSPVGDGAGQVIELFNPVDYASAVYSDTDQAPIHKDRWPTRSELREKIQPQVIAAFRAWVERITRL